MSENNRRLSRTHKGHSDTGSSEHKQPLLLAGCELLDQLEKNDVEVAKVVHSRCRSRAPESSDDVQELLFHIADLTNRGIVPGARFRTWNIAANQTSLTGGPAISGPEAKVPPEKLEEAVYDFAGTVLNRWPELTEEPIPLAAWAEWQLNGGPLHPFYDGCGRISRSFAATLLLTADSLLPLFDEVGYPLDSGSYHMLWRRLPAHDL